MARPGTTRPSSVRFAYASNGRGVYGIDMDTGQEGERADLPTPDELWNLTFAEADAGAIALRRCRSRIVAGTFRALLPGHRGGACAAGHRGRAATHPAHARNGYRQTFIAFQIAKLFQNRWNLTRTTRRPRILFLRPQHPGRSGVQRVLGVCRGCAGAHRARRYPGKEGQVPEERETSFHDFSDIHERSESSLPRRRESSADGLTRLRGK